MLKDRLLGNAPLIVGEIGQNHDGSLGMCHAYVDALADAGAHAIKFQTHISSAESTKDEKFRVKFSYQDETRFDYWRRMEFTEPQWAELKAHCDERGIGFVSTPFSAAAVELLDRIGVEIWKIGSGDTRSERMMSAILATGKPVMVSTGMSDWAEIDGVAEMLKRQGADFALFQCTSKYPTPLADVGLNVLEEMKSRYGCRAGLSDHTGLLAPSLAAIARGFTLIEVHASFDRRMFGPDVPASLTIEEIGMLARFADDVEMLDTHPVDKDAMAEQLAEQKKLFARSVALAEDRPEGHVLTEADLTEKKPGDGIPWENRAELVGKTLTRPVSALNLLTPGDFE